MSLPKVSSHEAIKSQKVSNFLSSIERNSLRTRYAYQNGLMNFQRFLSQKYPDFNLETILKPLAADEINRYELLDSFISYLQVSGLTPSSINFYMASVRSYDEMLLGLLRLRAGVGQKEGSSK